MSAFAPPPPRGSSGTGSSLVPAGQAARRMASHRGGRKGGGGGGGSQHRPRESLQRKLFLREAFGQIRSSRRPTRNEVSSKLFSRLPARLAFCLKDAVPLSAIEAGHIFLGFSKCGQFLLSYTQTTSDIDLAGGADLNIKYNYRLHWWLFVPYRRAKKVAEALLFSNSGVYGGLHISFCQWPGDWTKLVVYGTSSSMADYDCPSSSASSRPCYLTVTAVPSLAACKDCSKVAASYEEEDVAEGWNSCVRFSCLRHGLTIHTTFDLVPPYPSFEPRVSLKRDGHVLVNTGNILHSLHVDLETMGDEEDQAVFVPPFSDFQQEEGAAAANAGEPCGSSMRWSELHVGAGGEFTLHGGEVFSPPMCSPGGASAAACWSATSDSETTDCESEYGAVDGCRKKKAAAAARAAAAAACAQNEERMEKVARFVEELNNSPSPPNKKFLLSRRGKGRITRYSRGGRGAGGGATGSSGRLLSFQSSLPGVFQCHSYESLDDFAAAAAADPSSSSSIRKSMAEKAYELTDDDFDDGATKEKLSTFRKKRLAEKTYEFTEEDLENVTPLPRLRSQTSEARRRETAAGDNDAGEGAAMEDTFSVARSPRPSTSAGDVLRQIQENQFGKQQDQQQLLLADQEDLLVDGMASNVPELLSPGGMLKKDRGDQQSVMMSPRSSCGGAATSGHAIPARFQAKYTRRFFETDGELISVVTDVEDDDVGGTYYSGGGGSNCGAANGAGAAGGNSTGASGSTPAAASGYHTVLPLEVHGSGYQPMSMISSERAAERRGQLCVKVTQRSFDLEVFCYQMAQKLCQAAGKKYWFCNDYDVEVVDLDPASGDVILVAVVLVSATVFTKKVSQRDKCSISSLHRLQYQVGRKLKLES